MFSEEAYLAISKKIVEMTDSERTKFVVDTLEEIKNTSPGLYLLILDTTDIFVQTGQNILGNLAQGSLLMTYWCAKEMEKVAFDI